MGNVSTEGSWVRDSTNSTDGEADGAAKTMSDDVVAVYCLGVDDATEKCDVGVADVRGVVDETRFSFLLFLLRAFVFLPSQTVQTYGLVL